MTNQLTRQALYHSVYGDPEEDVLEHHGVSGMEWGERNGPPYPLSGANKRHAIKEWMENRKKKKRLKKLQKAAKKARKERKAQREEEAKEAKRQADIDKLKQKLVRKGDLDKIKKNAKYFTNEELEYIAERERAKANLKTKEEHQKDEKFELAMKRMGQLADIGTKAAVLFNAGKAGADMVAAFKGARLKDLEADEKYMKRIKDEFDVRSKINADAAADWFNIEMLNSGRDITMKGGGGASGESGGQKKKKGLFGRRDSGSNDSRGSGNQQSPNDSRESIYSPSGRNAYRSGFGTEATRNRRNIQNAIGSEWNVNYGGGESKKTGKAQGLTLQRMSGIDRTFKGKDGRTYRLPASKRPMLAGIGNQYTNARRTAGLDYRVSGGGAATNAGEYGGSRPSAMTTTRVVTSSKDGRTYTLASRNRYSGYGTNSIAKTVQNNLGSEWVTLSGGLALPVAALDSSMLNTGGGLGTKTRVTPRRVNWQH